MGQLEILFIAPQPFYENRGTPIAAKYILEALIECGYKVDLITYPLGQTIDLQEVRIFRVGNIFGIKHIPVGFSFKKLFLDLTMIPLIWKRLQKKRYRCIYAIEEAAFLAMFPGRWHKIPVIYDMHSSLPEQMRNNLLLNRAPIQKIFRFFERWLIWNTDLIVCSAGLGKYVQRIRSTAVVRECFFPSQPIEASHEEVKQLRNKLGILPCSPVVLYCGTFEHYQGLPMLINAAYKVISMKPTTVFILLGADPYAKLPFLGKTSELIEQGALRLVYRQPKSVVHQFLSMADVLVSPRQSGDNVPIKIFDYLAAGKPIVAIDTPAHRTLLTDQRALLVEPSAEEVAKGIVEILLDREKAQRLGDEAQLFAKKNLHWGQFVEFVSQLPGLAQGGERN